MKNCVNCDYSTDTAHCPVCGQKMEVQRVTFKGIISEFVSKWIGFDNQFGRTVIGMIKNPGEVVNSYLRGNRTRYLGPLGFFVIMTALIVISADLIGLDFEDVINRTGESISSVTGESTQTQQQIEMQQKINKFMAKNFRFVTLIIIPFWALVLYFFYKKHRFNYVERLVTVMYAVCQGLWLNLIIYIVLRFTDFDLTWYAMIVSILYYAYVFNSVFSERMYIVSFFKTVGIFIIGTIAAALFFGLILIIKIITVDFV